ncbi:MAG: TetR/AcrR family transcriptional regulator [Candidatus Lokiarchaeota archaeon]|nr:TetR/AcrR family transcriptional regulator [Candidatus Lokiarchaeota archaeon]
MKSYDKSEKIDRIIQSTQELILSNGIDNLTIRKIAKNANVSIGTIYRYFPDGIFSIIKEMTKNFKNQFIDNGIEHIIDYTDLTSFIRFILDKQIFLHHQNLELLRAFEYLKIQNPKFYRGLGDFMQFDENKIVQILSKFSEYASYDLNKLKDRFYEGYCIIDGAIHQHILYNRITDTDAELAHILAILLKKCLEIP